MTSFNDMLRGTLDVVRQRAGKFDQASPEDDDGAGGGDPSSSAAGPESFDPDGHTVEEVVAYLGTLVADDGEVTDPVEWDRVMEAEAAGKERVGVLSLDD